MNERAGGDRHRWLKGWRFVVLVVVGVVVLWALFLWFGPGPNVPRKPLSWARDRDGRLVPMGEPEAAPRAQLSARAEVTSGKTSMGTTTASSSSGDARFDCGRVVVINESNHPLVALAAMEMIERLKNIPYVKRIGYLPPDSGPEKERRAPGVCIRLNLSHIDESNLLIRRTLQARVLATACSSWVKSRHSYHDHLTPPRLSFHWQGRLQHELKAHGLASSAARYIQPAKEIGRELGKSLAGQFDKFYDKYGPMPDLPAEFYPAYRQPGPLPFLEDYDVEMLCSWHGLMNHNQTFWELEVPGHAEDAIQHIVDETEGSAWSVSNRGSEDSPYLRLTDNSVVVEVFPKDTEPSWPGPVVATRPPHEEGEPARSILYVRYLDRIDREELARAVDETLTEDTPLPTMLTFRSTWTEEQRQRAMEIVQESSPREPRAWITLAELYGDEQKDRARDALLRAHVLGRTVKEKGDLESRIRRLAKKLGIEDISDEPVPESLLRKLGFIEVKQGAGAVEVEVGVDEPVSCFFHTEKGLVTTTARVVTRPTSDGEMSYGLQLVSQRAGSRSWSEGGNIQEGSPVVRGASYGGRERLQVTVNKLPPEERFRVKVEVR